MTGEAMLREIVAEKRAELEHAEKCLAEFSGGAK